MDTRNEKFSLILQNPIGAIDLNSRSSYGNKARCNEASIFPLKQDHFTEIHQVYNREARGKIQLINIKKSGRTKKIVRRLKLNKRIRA